MLTDFANMAYKVGRRTWKYGYFAPLLAGWVCLRRNGNYLFHLRALPRLTSWHGDLY